MNDLRLPDERPLSRAHFHATSRELRRLPRRRRSRWGMTLALAGALVLLSAVAAVGYRFLTPQQQFLGVECYEKASLDPPVFAMAVSERDPIEQCRDTVWSDVDDASEPVELTACVTDTGYIAVLPADAGVCERLGLPAFADVEVTPEVVSVAQMNDALDDAISPNSGECLDTDEAQRRAERVLEELDATHWTLVRNGTAEGDAVACAGYSLEPSAREVSIVSVPGPESEEERLHALLQTRQNAAGDDCMTWQQARAMAEQAIRDLELTDWRVEVETEGPPGVDWNSAGVCAGFGQFQNKPIVLVVPNE